MLTSRRLSGCRTSLYYSTQILSATSVHRLNQLIAGHALLELCWKADQKKRLGRTMCAFPSLYNSQKKKRWKWLICYKYHIPTVFPEADFIPCSLCSQHHNEIQRCQSMSSSETKLCQTRNVNQLLQTHGCAFNWRCMRASQISVCDYYFTSNIS